VPFGEWHSISESCCTRKITVAAKNAVHAAACRVESVALSHGVPNKSNHLETTATEFPESSTESREAHGRRRESILTKIDRRFEAFPSRLRSGLIVVGTLVVGNLDFVTGGEISFSIFYLIPISAAARFHDRSTAVKTAIFAGLVWLLVELLAQPEFSHPLIPIWNAFGRTVFFLLLVGYITTVFQRDAWLKAEVTQKTAQLREMVSNQRILERRMAQAVAREQSEITRELHDGVGQYLAGLAFQARSLSDELQSAGSPQAERSVKLVQMLAETNRMLRRLDHILAPAIGGEGGLSVAFRRLVTDVRQFSGVECTLDLPAESIVIGEFQALTLFRIAQEAISNSVKHSGTGSVRLELSTHDTGLRLVVSDRGRGYDLVSSDDSGEGLRIMRHRAELIGARLKIRSAPGTGCAVVCELPWWGATPTTATGN
jgi:signal transduction histidine kinase